MEFYLSTGKLVDLPRLAHYNLEVWRRCHIMIPCIAFLERVNEIQCSQTWFLHERNLG